MMEEENCGWILPPEAKKKPIPRQMTNRRTTLSGRVDGEAGEFLDPGRHLDVVLDGRRYSAAQDANSAFDGRSGGHSLGLVGLDQN